MCLIFVGQGYPRKLFNLEHVPIHGILNTHMMVVGICINIQLNM